MVKKGNMGAKIFAWILTTLAVIGSIAWGVYGVTSFMGNPFLLVNWIFRLDWLANVIYIIVGLVGLSLIPSIIAMIKKVRK